MEQMYFIDSVDENVKTRCSEKIEFVFYNKTENKHGTAVCNNVFSFTFILWINIYIN